jgi:ABC-type sugar transport system ATPase subunit
MEKLNRVGVFQNVSFALKAGKIAGFAGLFDAGRTEVARTLGCFNPNTYRTAINVCSRRTFSNLKCFAF